MSEENTERVCFYCKMGMKELRPYGPNGEDVCAECVKRDPEKNKIAEDRFMKLMNMAGKATGLVLLTDRGPVPVPLRGKKGSSNDHH
jgi:hypothetical protein